MVSWLCGEGWKGERGRTELALGVSVLDLAPFRWVGYFFPVFASALGFGGFALAGLRGGHQRGVVDVFGGPLGGCGQGWICVEKVGVSAGHERGSCLLCCLEMAMVDRERRCDAKEDSKEFSRECLKSVESAGNRLMML